MTPSRGRILCIEDNHVNWRLVERLLAQAGFETHWAPEGLQGFQMARELLPDLILLDINLPGLSGFEIATKIRQQPELATVPLVALTAKTQRSDRETALVAGCSGFIPKPIDPFRFVEQVSAYLEGRQDRVDQAREGQVLRQFNQQVVEHLESQLRDAQDANRKLVEAQEALESRNRTLSDLLELSRSLLGEREPRALLERILKALVPALGLTQASAYHMDSSGGFLEGLRLSRGAVAALPLLPVDAPLPRLLLGQEGSGPLLGEQLHHSRFWDPGLEIGIWAAPCQACLVPFRDRSDPGTFWGFLALARAHDRPFLPREEELVALHSGMCQAGLENATLIVSLNESSRALGSSYERLESAYLDLQTTRTALGQKERQAVLGELFLGMAKRLERPVFTLQRESAVLAGLFSSPQDPGPRVCREEAPRAIQELRSACGQIDSLLKALIRRSGRESPATPEWLDLHDLLLQEMEFLEAEGVLPEGVEVKWALEAGDRLLHGVYGDFAGLLSRLVAHATGGPQPSPVIWIRSSSDGGLFRLEIQDEGGPILPESLGGAFEPFTGLRSPEAVLGLRRPGEGLPACAQILSAYQGRASIRNEGDGTLVELQLSLR
ncbi:MAG: response regulator [Acidobacteria bacterium]|nr:response regulator [Acidobacteriota bacterium]